MSEKPITILNGDALQELIKLPDQSVHCCVTSPPYWGLRDYGTASWEGGSMECDHGVNRWEGPKQTQGAQSGHASKTDQLNRQECECGARRVDKQIGLEESPQEYIPKLVEVFQEVQRVLRDDGTLWLNIGDGYCSTAPGTLGDPIRRSGIFEGITEECSESRRQTRKETPPGLKPKDLVGVPWRLAFALQASGWYLRSDIIWAKPNPMPESVTDRPTKSHEYIFLLSKSPRYHYDAEAIKEKSVTNEKRRPYTSEGAWAIDGRPPEKRRSGEEREEGDGVGTIRNKRTVWTVATAPYKESHFATFPPDLIKPCILAGCPVGGTVLDPFGGSGTTGMVALELGRNAILIELNPEYAAIAKGRCNVTQGLPL